MAAIFAVSPCLAAAETPLSAIDWLSDSLSAPAGSTFGKPVETDAETDGDFGVSIDASPEEVLVSPIRPTFADGVGLVPAGTIGWPANLWAGSSSGDIIRRLTAERLDILPAMQEVLYSLLLAEVDPPSDSGPESRLFVARIDTLLSLGALEQAQAMLDQAGPTLPELFRRKFDTALLLRTEDYVCNQMRGTPGLSPTFPARIFCLARGGDWEAAVLTLETARALELVNDEEDALLARFLDLIPFDPDDPLPPPQRPSPLEFRMFEAIGEALPTAGLPRAYAHSDLHSNAGWKAQLEAAERLARSGAIDPNRLIGYYTARKPAASGGVWERVAALQALEAALQSRDTDRLEQAVQEAWQAMVSVELEVPFARLYGGQLAKIPSLRDNPLVFRMALLSWDYTNLVLNFDPKTQDDLFLMAIAQGQPVPFRPKTPMQQAIVDGFKANRLPVRLQALAADGRRGEAILRAMELFENGSLGDLDELTDAIAFFNVTGLDDIARKASLQLLLLDRRG